MKSLFASVVCIVAVAGCSKSPSSSGSAQSTLGPAGAPVHSAAVPQGQRTVSGTVGETVEAAGYTYVRVQTSSGDVWAAVPQTTLQRGAPVTIDVQMVNDGFHSKTLGRTFDHLVFGTIAGGAQAPAESNAQQPPPGHPGMSGNPMMQMPGSSPEAAVPDVKVPKAEGKNAQTVAELWANRKSLAGKQVAVRGKVVKFLPQILGKNWVHLHDGTGSAADKTNDLTVTTQDTANVGDVVTATGTVNIDKDYCAGYAYPVILEEAKLSK